MQEKGGVQRDEEQSAWKRTGEFRKMEKKVRGRERESKKRRVEDNTGVTKDGKESW